MEQRNLVLIGFMGTGKSTIGKKLARRLNWSFKDTDYEIEQNEGKSIPEIFTAKGEIVFRELETAALKQILSASAQVVSTGGGCVLAEENRQLMLNNGFIIALSATADTIVSRVEDKADRPLLAGDPRERVTALLAKRQGLYDFAHLLIHTDDREPDEIVEQILREIGQGEECEGGAERQ